METTERLTARRRATREKLVAAALDLFGRNGIDATSVEQLCEAAGFTRGAFYSNFETKDDLCVAVARTMSTETVDACREILASASSRDDIGSLLTQLFRVSAFSPARQRTMMEMHLRANREPELARRLRGEREVMWPLLIEVVERTAEQAHCSFTLGVTDLLRLCEALYFSPTLVTEGTNLTMMAKAVEALTVQNKP